MTDSESQPTLPARTACGGAPDHIEQYPSALYRGRRVYFCNEACLRAFQSDPGRFMAGEIPHPTGADPTSVL
jgi:YHS domain-containing protein